MSTPNGVGQGDAGPACQVVAYAQIARSASLPSGSARVHQPGAWASPDDPAAGRERAVNSGLHLVVRHVDVNVEAVARHALAPRIDVRIVARSGRQLPDSGDQGQPGGERAVTTGG